LVAPLSPLWRRRRKARGDRPLESLLTEGFVAIDLETTGFDIWGDSIVELAAIRFVGSRVAEVYVTHVDPGRPIPAESTRIHGITDAMVAGAPSLDEVLPRLADLCGHSVLAGYGIDFDLAMLAQYQKAHGRPALANTALDCRRLAVVLHPEWKALGFEEVAALRGIGILGRHTAEGDAAAAGELLLALIPEIRALGAQTVDDAVWLQETRGGSE
jgi:DNA polymerase III epsilon subunit-like protein